MKIEFYRHNLGPDEIDSVAKALQDLFLTAGPRTRDFETEFGRWLGGRHVVGMFSCTSALAISLRALGIGEGDEVITTPMSFIATSNAVIEVGARPVFVDVEPATGNLDAERIEAAVTARTRAIIPVHLYGQMCDMVRIRQIADRHALKVIEDAAHCVEGERDGIRPGMMSDVACFSFYATKNLCSGEGGAAATNHGKLAEELRLLRSHGMSHEAADRYHGTYRHWDMLRLGYKANMFDLQAALLLPQLPKLMTWWKRRDQLWRQYEDALGGIPGVSWPRTIPGGQHARHLFTLWVPTGSRDRILADLQSAGVGCAVNYRPIHLLSYYRQRFGYLPGSFPRAEEIGERTISLPFYVKLSESELGYVADTIRALV